MEADHGQGDFPSVLRVPASRAGTRADVFLCGQLPLLSRTRIRQKIQMGESLLNGRRYSTATRLRAGDEIRVSWRARPPQEPVPDMEVLYEDDALLAVNKPAGTASHPMGRRQSGTVVQFARLRYEMSIRESLDRGDMTLYPTLVNRLDVFTSGVVILALTRPVHKVMQALIGQRHVFREYVALVEGEMEDEEGLIDLPIGPDTGSSVRLKMACRADGRESETRYAVLTRLSGHTLLRVTPHTGRQHQIRVHLAAIGHPVAGDLLYKDEALFLAAQDAASVPARHWLHARQARFIHPVTGEEVRIEAPIPDEFDREIRRLQRDPKLPPASF
jgi:23S rRNA pseudouridine1911/1915/1917 synthase